MRMLIALPLLALTALSLPPDDQAIRLASLVGSDPKARDSARRYFLRRGTPMLAALEGAAAAAQGEAEKAVLLGLAKEIRRREPHGLSCHVGLPKMKLTLATVNGRQFDYSVTIENRGAKPVVLLPYLALRVLDSDGNEVKPSSRRGRWGRRRDDHTLGGVEFVTIEPGKRWSFKDRLERYMHDPRWITGWKLPGAGNYTLVFTYSFDRAAWKKRGKQDWKPLNDPKQPWNVAPEFQHSFKVEMRVDR